GVRRGAVPGEMVSRTAGADALYMARALGLAERGRGRTSPNPMVGAVVVDEEGVVVGRGAHERAGGPHAEILALADAGTRARGGTLYCTLEPCIHTGRTGPCAPRVVEAGIRRAVIAGVDPNPLVAGRGLDHLREHGVEVSIGVLEDDAARLNRPFFMCISRGRPLTTVKVALTLDGCVSTAPGVRSKLTGEAADRAIHRERAEVDAIGIGSETLLADDPLLTARGVFRHRPLIRVVFDRRLRTPPGCRLLSTQASGPVIIMTLASSVRRARVHASTLVDAGARLEQFDDPLSSCDFLRGAVERLSASGILSLVVEGGPTLHRAFWDARLVDRMQLYVTPAWAGSQGVRWDAVPLGTIAGIRDGMVKPIGGDVLIEGYVHGAD
ncbi:MAG TPA: bifunctional diaminohydroxyphosphoribosylaminopyrimidine deaminase/5-amino-6-(5-phosphoribosylamino)uracil reductase RibD, partial [Vicinamibacterales bacterium]|nr:bifunctional diaminohydroxyphosphoribosylaminopyrimidine deaminase/5-amino-6-(5-phosphoribosylamino)uracil reductase RibD [Vicinamibacterales bacterium]